jgi:hypothetical protein
MLRVLGRPLAFHVSTPAAALLVLAMTSMHASARAADSKEACFDAYEQAQRLRKENKLRASAKQLELCAQAACPSYIKTECTKWSGEVEALTPTIVVSAKDALGKPTEAVRVSIDGEPVAERLDGKPIAVDAGSHTVRYEHASKTIEERVDVAEGKKDQPLVADFEKLAQREKADADARRASERPPEPPPPARANAPIAAWLLGGVAVAGAVSFVAFGLAGKSIQSCSPTCTRSEVDALRRDYLVADVSLAAALVAGGISAYLFLSPRSAAESPSTTGIRFTIQPRTSGALLGAEGRF